MKTESESALETAKSHRAQASTAVPVAAVTAAAKAAAWDLSEAHVRKLKQRRIGAVAVAKPADVLAIDAELLRAQVEIEIAEAHAVASKSLYTEAVAALSAADAVVTQAARAQLDSEMIAMAAAFNDAFDAALKIGERLQAFSSRNHLNIPLNVSVPPVPPAVVAALERLPKPNPYNVPVSELRFGASSDAWARRFAELAADDEPKSIDVAA
jgi:hypothetical protein